MSCINFFESNCECSTSSSDLTDEVPQVSSPFNLQWAFGFDTFTPVINLSTSKRSLIAYACSHVTVLYDYKSRKMFKLQGHRNCVRILSIDQTGKWLLTADFENDSTVVIWDIEKRIPIFTLFNPHKENKMTAAALSPDAKYIVTVGNEDNQSVKFWFWTFGNGLSDAEIDLTETSSERVKDIAFDWQNPNFLALTTDSRVTFIQMDHGKNLFVHCPTLLKKPSRLGIFNNTAFITETSKAFTGTEKGFVLVWDKDPENIFQEYPTMIHIKSIPLQKFNITKIINYLGMLVTGNSRGDIIFYNNDLQVLYACRDCGLDFVTSISFDIQFESHHDFDYEMPGEHYGDDESASKSNGVKLCGNDEERVEIPSNVTMKIEHPPKPKYLGKSCNKKCLAYQRKFEKFRVPRDATLKSNQFAADKFIVATKNGKMAWIDIPRMECRRISNHFDSTVTALDVHPQNKYFIAGDENGSLYLFNFANHQLKLKRSVPELPDLLPTLKSELLAHRIVHVTYSDVGEDKTSHPSAIKYSPNANVVICGLANGAFWVLHPDTFEALDEAPYRHSETPILDVAFSACSNYMAYYDDASTVAVFKRRAPLDKAANFYDFVGKYRAHSSACRCILFEAPDRSEANKKSAPRFLSLGEDRDLVEYDLLKSGTYPRPGLLIKEISKVEREEVPFFMDWYPRFGVENCLVISNSDYKLKLINAVSKEVRATTLGSSFDSPIKKMIIHQLENHKNIAFMIFATDRQIGLQLLPLDGNPHKILTAIGHPRKITWMRISHCGNLLFTAAQNDRCVLVWKINYKSVEMTHRLGGTGLGPFYSLVDGGKEGWLFQEMQDLFVYAQILEQGKNSMKARRIDDEVGVEQLPNLVRAVGFYPTDYQMENLLNEVVYKDYPSSGKMNTRITFEEFVKLYVNHRPTFGISMEQLRYAFAKLGEREGGDDFSISKQQFFDILCGNKSGKRGDALNMKEIDKYLECLMYGDQNEHFSKLSKRKSNKSTLDLLPGRISYKDFVANVMGITISNEMESACQ